ncbi:MAG: hypothetical protein M3131_01505, partial [Actinomycetota bacterium]|nr:hypothetical protein [Actinomycetota bacterium]
AGSRIAEDGNQISEAVVWDKRGVATKLAQLPGGSYGNVAHGINNAGQTVGVAVETHDHPHPWKDEFAFQHAVTWDRRGALTELPLLPEAEELGAQALATAINDRGTIVGWASGPPIEMWGDVLNGTEHAVIWKPTPRGGYTITRLGQLPGTEPSQATDINNRGQVAGYAQVDGATVAVTWDRDGSPTALPALPGAEQAQATGINSKGEIVGWAQVEGKIVPLLWTPVPGGGYTVSVLGDLGGTRAHANDINDAGVIVGRASLPDGQERAILWTPTRGGGYTITELCPLSGDTFSEGNAINNEGRVTGRSIGGDGDVQRPVRWDT